MAPLKQLTIPRLELQAAVLASRLAKTIQEESRIKFKDFTFFTDSTIKLAWILSTSGSFRPFVSSRVGVIQGNSNPSQWRHIPGEFNVADDISRGIRVQDLNKRWCNGPEFLQLPESESPQETAPLPPKRDEMEYQQQKIVGTLTTTNTDEPTIPQRFSSWRRLIRVTALIKRLAQKIRARSNGEQIQGGPLTPSQLQEAETLWLKAAQTSLHSQMHKKEFDALSPFLDDKGVIRVGGRVDNAVVTYESRHPALLPYEHRISLLITRYMHQCGQSGVATTTAKIRARYWILKASKLTKSVKFKYSLCQEMAQRAETQQMADLPSLCLAPFTPPFHYTACNYFRRKTLRSDFHVLKYPNSSS